MAAPMAAKIAAPMAVKTGGSFKMRKLGFALLALMLAIGIPTLTAGSAQACEGNGASADGK